MKKFGLVFISLILLAFSSSAQKGTLRGKIIDKTTGETLIGATIVVQGTTKGTISDFDGNYSLDLDPGTYHIEVSFVSYEKQIFEAVNITSGEVTVLNANLGKAETKIDEVVITARARRRTENAMQIMQRKSGKVMDGISYEKIAKLGDSNAAQALKRVPGVSVEGGKYVYVRGLSDRYTKTTLNGSSIPALDPEKYTVQMDIFPSNIIENIVINKTFTPDMPGESTGGHVDIITKDFPNKFSLAFSTSVGFNPQANLNDEFITYPGGDTDWLGYGDGSREIPNLTQKALKTMVKNDLGAINKDQFSNITEITQSFTPVMSTQQNTSFLNHSHKFSIGNQINLLGNALGYNLAISYSRDFEYYDGGINNMFEDQVTPSVWKRMDDDTRSEESVIAAGLLNLNYKLSNNNKVGVRLLKNQSGNKVSRRQDGYFNYERKPNRIYNLSWLERGFDYYQLHGKHVFPGLNKSILTWQGSMTNMTQDEPDQRFFEYLYETDRQGEPDHWQLKTNDVPVRFFREMEQTNYNGNIDLEIPFQVSGNPFKFKTGASLLDKDREQDNIRFSMQRNLNFLNQYPFDDINSFLVKDVWSDNYTQGYYYESDHNTNLQNSYQATQSLLAFYGMFDMPVTEKIRIVAGVRYEMSEITTADKNKETEDRQEKQYKDLLPSMNFTYSLQEDMNIRLALSRTLARPKFREIGSGYYDYELGYYIYGNKELDRSLINNLDLRWEYFFNRGEKIAVSGFYKGFRNPIEYRLLYDQNNYAIRPKNAKDATVYGFEVELSKDLDFIPVLKNFSMGGNFSYIKSEIDIPRDQLENYIWPADPDHEASRPMQGQAPFIVNANLGYSNPDLGLNSNLGFHITGEKLALVTKGRLPYLYEQPRPSLNFNISKSLAENLALEVSVKNIFDAPYEKAYHFEERDGFDRKYSLGRTFSFKVSYSLR